MATKPSGRPNSSSAPTTPISPSGRISTTIARRRKLISRIIMNRNISRIIIGMTENTLALESLLDSYRPPVSTR